MNGKVVVSLVYFLLFLFIFNDFTVKCYAVLYIFTSH